MGTVLKKRLEIPIGYLFNAVNFIVIAGNAILYDLGVSTFHWSLHVCFLLVHAEGA